MDRERLLHHEWSYFDGTNAKIKEYASRAPDDDYWAQSVRERFARKFGNVEQRTPERYDLPIRVRDLSDPARVGRLQELLHLLCEFNNMYVGEDVRDLHVILNEDPIARGLQFDLVHEAGAYTRHRCAELQVRNVGCPVQSFLTIFEELCAFTIDLSNDLETLNSIVLEMVSDYTLWFMAHETWMPFVRFQREKNFSVTIQTRFSDGYRREYCSKILQMTGWMFEHNFQEVASILLPTFAKGDITDIDRDSVLARIGCMADGIQTMRPLLIRNFKPLKSQVELTPGCWVMLSWGLRHRIGAVDAGISPAHLIEQHERGTQQLTMALGLDGLLASSSTPWMNAISFRYLGIPEPLATVQEHALLAVNLRIIEALHDKLFSFYEKIDLRRVFRELAQKAESQELEDAEAEEFIAAGAQLLDAEPPDEVRSGEPVIRVIRGMRSQAFFRALEVKLGCEVRQGKGSEIVLHRPGHRLFTLGHHKSNDTIRPGVINRVLRRLGISLRDWAVAIGLLPSGSASP